MEVALIRHTACAVDAGICYGQLDVPLASSAPADIDGVLAQTPRVDAIYTSPALRCVALATRLATRDGCEPIPREDLRELSFGRWEGTRWDAISRTEIDEWSADHWNRAPPEGESERALWARVDCVYQELRGRNEGRVAVIAHGGSLRALRCLLTHRPRESRWAWSPKHGEVLVLKTAPYPGAGR